MHADASSKKQERPAKPADATRLGLGVLRFSTAYFLAALLALFVAFPMIDDLHQGDVIGSALMSLVLGLGLLAIGRRRSTLIIGLIFSVPAFVGRWSSHLVPGLARPELVMGLEMVFVAFVLYEMLRYILTTRVVNSEVLCAGVSVYLLCGLLWTFAYLWISVEHPASFMITIGENTRRPLTSFEACYFSFVTLTTMGYGDIVPTGKLSRALAALEAMVGVLYLAVMIARLVGLHASTPPPATDEEKRGTHG